MKFRSIANPPPSMGVDYSQEPILVVPDQSIKLEEMLRRFTLGEPLDVEHKGSYVDDLSEGDNFTDPNLSDVDLEKVAHLDLVDREEFANKLKETRVNFEKKEKKAEAARKRKEAEEAAEIEEIRKEREARKREKEAGQGPPKTSA